jgi:predicted  nucleic acid-binding Zn-ribbon protein
MGIVERYTAEKASFAKRFTEEIELVESRNKDYILEIQNLRAGSREDEEQIENLENAVSILEGQLLVAREQIESKQAEIHTIKRHLKGLL